MTDWGVPDGRDPVAYGDTIAWSDDRWHWEFTRRRQDYRDDFDRFAKQTYDLQALVHEQVLSPDQPGFRATMPGPVKYGLVGLPNPRLGEQPSWAITFQSGRGLRWFSECAEFWNDNERCDAILRFDLSIPIPAQIEAAKSMLLVRQEEMYGKLQRRRDPDMWLIHLRAMDAKAAGYKHREIAEILWPGDLKKTEASVSETLAAAWKLRGYIPF